MDFSSFDISNITSFVISPPFPRTLLVLKILFISAFLYFLGSIIYSLVKSHYIQWLYGEMVSGFFTRRPYGIQKIDRSWAIITEKLKSGFESDYKLAVIEADGVLDEILERIGYKGENLEERLKQLSLVHLPNLDDVWKAHKIRNDIVRDPDYQLSFNEAKKVLAIYKKTLEDLETF